MSEMSQQQTIEWWANELKVTKDAIQKFAAQLGNPIAGQEMPQEVLIAMLPKWSIKRGQRTEETVQAARQWAATLGIALPEVDTAIPPAASPSDRQTPIVKRKRWVGADASKPAQAINPMPQEVAKENSSIDKFFRSRVFLFAVFLAAMAFQIQHTTIVAIRLEIGDAAASNWQYALGYLFSFAVQFTALLMTINRGGQAYLVIFAIAEFLVNLIYYRPWHTSDNMERWVTSILISALIAYVIYSYSELFTDKRK